MTKEKKEKRQKICEDLDKKLLKKLSDLSDLIDYPQSRMIEDGIRYIIKKQIVPKERIVERKDITLTINRNLWFQFQDYADSNHFKLVHLLEEVLKYSLKKYKRKYEKEHNS